MSFNERYEQVVKSAKQSFKHIYLEKVNILLEEKIREQQKILNDMIIINPKSELPIYSMEERYVTVIATVWMLSEWKDRIMSQIRANNPFNDIQLHKLDYYLEKQDVFPYNDFVQDCSFIKLEDKVASLSKLYMSGIPPTTPFIGSDVVSKIEDLSDSVERFSDQLSDVSDEIESLKNDIEQIKINNQ